MTLGKSQYPYNLFIGDKSIETESTLKILGVTLDRELSLKPNMYEGISMTKFNNLKVKRVKSNLKYTESKLVKERPR